MISNLEREKARECISEKETPENKQNRIKFITLYSVIVRIVNEHEHVRDVYVPVRVLVIKSWFHEFLLVVLINVDTYLHVVCVTKQKKG